MNCREADLNPGGCAVATRLAGHAASAFQGDRGNPDSFKEGATLERPFLLRMNLFMIEMATVNKILN